MTKKLLRSKNRMIAGVCAGFADYFDLDVSLVRLGYVVLSVVSAGFPGILVYIIAWIIIPEDREF